MHITALTFTNFYFSNGYDFLCNTFHQITDKCRLMHRCKWSGSESSLTIATVTMEDGTQWKVNCKYRLYNFSQNSVYAQYAQKFALYLTTVTVNNHLFFAFWVYLRTMWVSNPKYKTRSEAGFSRTAAMKTWWCKVETPCVSICKHSILLCMYMYA